MPSLLTASAVVLGAETPSAGGAPVDQVLVVAVFTAALYAALLWVLVRERSGHATLVGRAADAVGRRDGSPRWFGLPLAVSVAGALSGAVGLYWDVSFHIALGRDEGPLANPAHYLIFLGLIAIFAGGALALALADDRLPRRTLRLTRSWRVPVGPAVGTAVALFALLGFPLDDVWHRLFGQDVTEWGPTHVLMIGGVLMLPYTMLLTCAEVRQVGDSWLRERFEWVAVLVLAAGPVAFLLEFAFGVPQFPLVNDPVVLALATVVTFTLAMYRGLRWVVSIWAAQAALQAALVGLNVWAFDALTPWPPVLLGGALVAAALTRRARPTVGFGAAAGVAMAMGMLLVEYFWTQATRPMPWPTAMMPWAVLFAGVTGAAVGVVATWMHRRLTAVAGDMSEVPAEADVPGDHGGRWALAAAFVLVAVFVVNVPPAAPEGGTADVTVGEVRDGRAHVTVRVDPELVEDAYWFEVLAWQGGGAVRGRLEPVREGVWRTDVPVPVSGSWKTLVRLHTPLHELAAAPVYLPADPAIPAAERPATSGPRRIVEEKQILRREEKQGVPGWLWGTAYGLVGVLFAGLFTTVALGYHRAAAPTGPRRSPFPGDPSRPGPLPRTVPAARTDRRSSSRPSTTRLRTHDGLDLHVHVEGPDDAGLTVVLAHCWTSDHDSWRYQVRDLRHRFGDDLRVVTYDHRGHGASDATPEQAATIENLARDLSDLIDAHASPGDLVLGGHSLGGMTLMALAEHRPELFSERVRGVLFVATSGGSMDEVTLGLPRLGEKVRAQIPAVLALRSRLVSRRRRRNAPFLEAMVARRFLFGDDMRLRDHALTVEGIINTPAASMRGFFEDVMRHDRVEGLSTLAGVPVHVLVGDRDRLTPPSHAELLAARVPGARLTVAPGAGHMLPLERDALVTAALVDLVERAQATDRGTEAPRRAPRATRLAAR